MFFLHKRLLSLRFSLLSGLFLVLISSIAEANNTLSPQELFEKSVNIFSHEQMSFVIDSKIMYGEDVTESRSFFIASKKQDRNNGALLLRFIGPQDIKCTAILMNKVDAKLHRYVYFPSLKRVRVIPESDNQKEVLGMGISYEEMAQPKGLFSPVSEETIDGKTYLKLDLVNDSKKTVFLIKPDSFDLKSIHVYQKDSLQKEVQVKEVREAFGERLIFAWSIKDFTKNRTISYQMQNESITNQVDDAVFYKNRLKRCMF